MIYMAASVRVCVYYIYTFPSREKQKNAWKLAKITHGHVRTQEPNTRLKALLECKTSRQPSETAADQSGVEVE